MRAMGVFCLFYTYWAKASNVAYHWAIGGARRLRSDKLSRGPTPHHFGDFGWNDLSRNCRNISEL
jgi:hypothetical protein